MNETLNRNEAVCQRVLQDCVLNERILHRNYASGIQRVISVSGAAALGKTVFCKCLSDHLKGNRLSVTHVELDGFLRNREVRRKLDIRGYNPRATDLVALLHALELLIHHGESVNIPSYDHKTGRTDEAAVASPAEVIILDGIMSLHYEIRERFPNFGIFLQADDLTMRGLRLWVDMQQRGYTIFEALDHVDAEGRSYDRWIHHQIDSADLVLVVDKHWGLSIKDDSHNPTLHRTASVLRTPAAR